MYYNIKDRSRVTTAREALQCKIIALYSSRALTQLFWWVQKNRRLGSKNTVCGSKFSHLLKVRAEGVDPLPYSHPDCKISGSFLRLPFMMHAK